jgi:hypothetical protein
LLANQASKGVGIWSGRKHVEVFSRQDMSESFFPNTPQLDCEEQITNIFWSDAKMCIDYAHFGDVVTFDTTFDTKSIGLLVFLLDSTTSARLLFLVLLFCLMKHMPLSNGYLKLF